MLSVLLRYKDSDYPFGILWPLRYQFFFDIQILITPLVSFGHCVVCSSIHRFWLPLWYLLAIVLSVLLRYADPDYPFGIFWLLCCQFLFDIRILITPFGIFWPLCRLPFFDIEILITPLVSFGHRVFSSSSIYGFWLPFLYLLAIVLSVLLRYTDSDYPFGILWPLCCQFFFDIQILITPLVSCGHCVVSSSSIYRFWLPLWYLVAIVLSVLLRYTDSNYPFGIFWSLCCQFFFDIRILITPLVSCGHYVVCSSSICGSWLSLWYIMTIVSSALLRYTDSDYPFCIFWPLCRLLFFDIEILITPLVSFGHCVVSCSSIYRFWLPLWYLLAIVLSVLLRYTDSDYPFGIFWPSRCQFFFDILILITPLVSFGHRVVSSSSIYGFWLPFLYLLAIVFSILLRYTDSDYPFGIFWPLCCQFFFDIRILITPLVSWFWYRFWLPLWYLLAIVLSVLIRYRDSDYPFGIFWPLCCQFVFDIHILITPLVSFGHCVVSASSIYGFWLPLWYLLAIMLSVLLRYTDSDYPFGIFWPLCCQFLFDIGIRITPLVSFGHCVVSSSSIYGFWLPLWYLVAIMSSALLRYRDSDYPLVSFGHHVVSSSSIYWFWFWYHLAIVSSALLRYRNSDYPFDIFWPSCFQFFFDIRILITLFVSFGYCVVSSSSIYGF